MWPRESQTEEIRCEVRSEILFINLFICSYNRYLLSVDYVPEPVLGYGAAVVKPAAKVLSPWTFPLVTVNEWSRSHEKESHEKGSQRGSRSQGPEAERSMAPSRASHVLFGWNPERKGEASRNKTGLVARGPDKTQSLERICVNSSIPKHNP